MFMGDVVDIGAPSSDTVSTATIQDDAVTAAKLANSINTEIAANTAKVTNATHTGDVTGATALTIADNAVTLAKLEDGTQGDVLYYGASGAPARLGFGTTGDFLKTQGTGANPVWATIAGGLSDSSYWRVSTDFTVSSDPTIITTNLEEVDTDGYGRLGSAMTESSGVFSFPATGIWLVHAQAGFERNAAESIYNEVTIDTTVDDGTWTVAATASNFFRPSSGYAMSSSHTSLQFDVTDVSTHKVRFKVDCQDNSTTCRGNSNMNETCFAFTKLGDT
jgi:hypothetical protein